MSRNVIGEYAPQREASLVHDTWARSYMRADGVRLLDPALYYRWHRQLRDQILARSTTLMLRDAETPDYVYGYIVAEALNPDTMAVHWAYVRSRERGKQYGYQLLAAALAINPGAKNLIYTHRTYFASKAEELGFTYRQPRELNYEAA